MSSRLLIRADASARIGTGHVMRCLALAQALQVHGQSHFLSVEITPALAARVVAEGFASISLAAAPGSLEDADTTIASAREHGVAWVVVDGYQFGADYQRRLKDAGLRVLFLDDYGHAGDYCADLVLNQNLSATVALYPQRSSHTRLLLGTRYALLRREFLVWRERQRKIPSVARKIIVTLGGADPDNVTSRVVEALAGLDVEARILVGGSNPHREQLKSAIRNPKSEIIVDAPNMPELMAWADVAVAAGGSTSWELAFMGLPSLVLVLAHNQQGISAALGREGVSVALGWAEQMSPQSLQAALQGLLLDKDRRRRMVGAGRALVDGEGSARIVNFMKEKRTDVITPVVPQDFPAATKT